MCVCLCRGDSRAALLERMPALSRADSTMVPSANGETSEAPAPITNSTDPTPQLSLEVCTAVICSWCWFKNSLSLSHTQPQQQRAGENTLLDLLGGSPITSQPPPITSNGSGGNDLLNLLDMPAQPVSTAGQTSSDPANLMSLLGGGGGGASGGGGMGGLDGLLGGFSNSAPVSSAVSVPVPAAAAAPLSESPPVPGVPGVCVRVCK